MLASLLATRSFKPKPVLVVYKVAAIVQLLAVVNVLAQINVGQAHALLSVILNPSSSVFGWGSPWGEFPWGGSTEAPIIINTPPILVYPQILVQNINVKLTTTVESVNIV